MPHKFVVIFSFLSTFSLLIDFYIVRKWSRFFKKYEYPKYFNRIIWGLFIAFNLSFIFGNFYKIYTYNEFSGAISKMAWVELLTLIWFLPKLVIFPILLISDLIKALKRVWKNQSGKIALKRFEAKPEEEKSEIIDPRRRRIIQTASLASTILPFAIVSKGAINTIYDFKIHNIDIPLENLPSSLDGLKIVQLADLHLGSFRSTKPFQEAKFIAEVLKPDILLITGDFVNFHPNEMLPYMKYLSNMKADIGVYACLGNHDHYMTDENHAHLIQLIKSTGMDLIINDNRLLKINNSYINLAATDNSGMSQDFGDFDKVQKLIDNGNSTILMCHDPNNFDKHIAGKMNADLTLAGHTHGGQVGLELGGLNLMPVSLAYKYYAGHYQKANQHLYVNRGLGTTGFAVRIGINPEITVLTLRKHIANLA